jgi:hypothetical protein
MGSHHVASVMGHPSPLNDLREAKSEIVTIKIANCYDLWFANPAPVRNPIGKNVFLAPRLQKLALGIPSIDPILVPHRQSV